MGVSTWFLIVAGSLLVAGCGGPPTRAGKGAAEGAQTGAAVGAAAGAAAGAASGSVSDAEIKEEIGERNYEGLMYLVKRTLLEVRDLRVEVGKPRRCG